MTTATRTKERTQTAVQTPTAPKVDTPVYPGDPKRELTELEGEALNAGMSRQELGVIQSIGSCEVQVRQRIAKLRECIPQLKSA